MVDTLTMTLIRALRSFSNPPTTSSSIERWAEVEFGKESKFAISYYNTHGIFPSEKHLR